MLNLCKEYMEYHSQTIKWYACINLFEGRYKINERTR